MNTSAVTSAFVTTGYFKDSTGWNSSSAHVTIAKLKYAGIFAYTAQNELVNMASLTGLSTTSNIVVYGVRNRYVTNDQYNHYSNEFTVLTPYSLCSAPFPISTAFAPTSYIVDVLPGCIVAVNKHHANGKADVPISVVFGEFNTTVPYRIWFAMRAKVTVKDPILNRIV